MLLSINKFIYQSSCFMHYTLVLEARHLGTGLLLHLTGTCMTFCARVCRVCTGICYRISTSVWRAGTLMQAFYPLLTGVCCKVDRPRVLNIVHDFVIGENFEANRILWWSCKITTARIRVKHDHKIHTLTNSIRQGHCEFIKTMVWRRISIISFVQTVDRDVRLPSAAMED